MNDNIKIGLLGRTGKMGKAVVTVAEELCLELYSYSHSEPKSTIDDVFQKSDVIIDFSIHEVARQNISLAEKHHKPILIATTGHPDPDALKSQVVPVLYAPNTCTEWHIVKKAIIQLLSQNENFVVTIDDIHAPTKRDKPSGTAKELVQKISQVPDMRSIRKVNLASWHKICMFDTNQVVNLEHQVLDRSVYAKGAINLAKKMPNLAPGLYLVEDLI